MIILDTNVLVYAVGRNHALKVACRRIVEAIRDRQLDSATTTVEGIQEFLDIRSRIAGREDAIQLANDYANLLSPLIEVSERDLRAGTRLYERHPDLDAFDAVLAAVAIANDARALVSADTAFATIPRLRFVDPAGPDLAGLISS